MRRYLLRPWSALVVLLCAILMLPSCVEDIIKADMVIHGGHIYTGKDGETVEAVAVKNGKIAYVGKKDVVMELVGDSTKVLDLQGKTMTPGFIESHAHIMGIGYNRLNIDLLQVKSYEELIQKVEEVAENTPEGQWIIGRGWHQDKWDAQPESRVKGFPTHHELSERIPDHPVWLSHASGHMGLANAAAMEAAGITGDTPQPAGGEIFMGVDRKPTGIFNETAQMQIGSVIPANDEVKDTRALELAVQELLENGITSMHNAGASGKEIALFNKFGKEDKLTVRVYTMISGSDSALVAKHFAKGPQVGLHDNHLTIRSVKLYADGALGSRGAWLLEEYTDAPGKFGHNVMPMEAIEDVTERGFKKGFQICVHAIGDKANREVLDIFEEQVKDSGTDHRFRVEHAQHIDPADIPRFAELGVIASVQAIHMSSDRPWAIDRLGKKRIEDGAYVWQKLIQSGAKVINGTDAPVEPVSALASFYSSVSRQTLKGLPEGGYEPDQKMTRDQALRAYTLDAAYGAFEEDIKGSIEPGKLADFTVFDKNIMTIPVNDILKASVTHTIVDGKVAYKK